MTPWRSRQGVFYCSAWVFATLRCLVVAGAAPPEVSGLRLRPLSRQALRDPTWRIRDKEPASLKKGPAIAAEAKWKFSG